LSLNWSDDPMAAHLQRSEKSSMEHGHITFLNERYELTDCKAYFSNGVQFQCTGPDVFFRFSKLRIRDAIDPTAYLDFKISSDTDDGDLGDYANFTFFGEDRDFQDPWEVTCISARPDKGIMAFEWSFMISYGTGRIPKRKRMFGAAKCSLTLF
jgi:hypothetical protein